MEKFSRADVAALVAALGDPSGKVRVAALRALVRLPLAPDVRTQTDTRIAELLRTPPSGDTLDDFTVDGFLFREVIDAAIFSHSAAPFAALRDLLSSRDKDVQKAAVRALSRARDPSAIEELLRELKEENDPEKRADAAQFLSLHDNFAYEEELNKRFRSEKDPPVRLWLALALARLGQIDPLTLLQRELDEGRITRQDLEHDYDLQTTVPEKLSPYGAFPEAVSGYLKKNWGMIYGNPDFGYSIPIQGTKRDPAEAQKALKEIQEWYRQACDIPLPPPLDTITPERLSPALAAQIISEYFRTYDRTQIGFDRKIDAIVLNLPKPYTPDLSALFISYLDVCRTIHAENQRYARWKIAWFISRAGTREVIRFVSRHLKPPAPEDERIAAANLVEDTIRLAGQKIPPVFGGPSSITDVPPIDRRIRVRQQEHKVRARPATRQWDVMEKQKNLQDTFMPGNRKPAHIGYTTTENAGRMYADYTVKASETWGFRDSGTGMTPSGAIAADAPEKPEKPRKKTRRRRVVNTVMRETGAPDGTCDVRVPLQPGTEYYFTLDIGRPDRGSMEAVPSDIPEVPANTCLLVALFSSRDGIRIRQGAGMGELRVHGDGNVTAERQPLEGTGEIPASKKIENRLYFPVCTPEREGKYRLRCNIYHKQVLLQSRLIRIAVGGKPDGTQALVSELDYTLSHMLDPAHLARFSEHRLSIMINRNDDGTHNFYVLGSDGKTPTAERLDINKETYASAIKMVRNTLMLASWGSKEEWKSAWNNEVDKHYRYFADRIDLARLKNDLVNMAIYGYNIYSKLNTKNDLDKYEAILSQPGAIQIAMENDPDYYFPAACIYDTYVRDDTAMLCPQFLDALSHGKDLEDTACFRGTCRHAQESDGKIVCPGRFWGFRHSISMPLSIQDDDVPAEISVDDDVIIAYATAEDLMMFGDHFKKLGSLQDTVAPPRWDKANSFDEVIAAFRKSPHIIYFYCHGGGFRHGERDEDPFLQAGRVGQQFRITVRDIGGKKIVWENPRPLVILNGCHTAAVTPLAMLNFVEPLLLRSHCAGVIGTEITIFEQMATVFGEECMRRFLKGDPIGTAVRGARLKVLAGGNPLALAYIPFVPGDLRLVKT